MVVHRATPWGAQAYELSATLSRQHSGMGFPSVVLPTPE